MWGHVQLKRCLLNPCGHREHSVELSCVNRPRGPACGDSGVQGKGPGRGSEDLGVRLCTRTRCLVSLNHHFHNRKNKDRNHPLALPPRYADGLKKTGPERALGK